MVVVKRNDSLVGVRGENMEFRRIRELREDHYLTKQESADVIGLSREVYRRYEEGIREMCNSISEIL